MYELPLNYSAVLTFTQLLCKPEDRLCIVAFSTAAAVVMPMTQMSAGNQERAKNLVDTMTPGGTTNLWDGNY